MKQACGLGKKPEKSFAITDDGFEVLNTSEVTKDACPLLEPLTMLLNSTINVEFVYLILEGISQLSLLNIVRSGLTKD